MSDRYRCRKIDCPGARLFSCLPAADAANLDRERVARRYDAGQTVIHSDTPALSVLLVHSGEVRLTRVVGSGRVMVGRRTSGALLGLREVLSGTPHQSTVETTKRSILCATPRDALLEALERCPKLSLQLLGLLAKDHLVAEEQLVARTHLSVMARTARLLLALRDDPKRENGSLATEMVTMSREEMALLVGTTRESLSRSLNGLAQQGLVELRNGTVRVLDSNALEAVSEDLPASVAQSQ